MQGPTCGFNHLTYVFEGVSDDGRFFAMMHRGVSNPEATRALSKLCTDWSRGQDFVTVFDKEMPALFDKDVSAAEPASFRPNLDQLDAVARSLKIKQ